MQVAQVIGMKRRALDWSQEKLAELVGVSRQAVAKWEAGEALPDLGNLVALANIFGTRIDELVNGERCGESWVPEPVPGSLHARLGPFLLRAKAATYAGNGTELPSSRQASHDLAYREDDLSYYDTYLGGHAFSGQEAVWESGEARWTMNYCGRVSTDAFSGDFLKEALRQVTLILP